MADIKSKFSKYVDNLAAVIPDNNDLALLSDIDGTRCDLQTGVKAIAFTLLPFLINQNGSEVVNGCYSPNGTQQVLIPEDAILIPNGNSRFFIEGGTGSVKVLTPRTALKGNYSLDCFIPQNLKEALETFSILVDFLDFNVCTNNIPKSAFEAIERFHRLNKSNLGNRFQEGDDAMKLLRDDFIQNLTTMTLESKALRTVYTNTLLRTSRIYEAGLFPTPQQT